MKIKLTLSLCLFLFFVLGHSQTKNQKSKTTKKVVASKIVKQPTKEIVALREKHACYLEESPFKKSLRMTKAESKSNGIPPNKYYETEWELTIDPETGKPSTDKLIALREQLIRERAEMMATGRTPGDATDNNWVERGPTNVGGRTRAVMFDPNDATKETVFAGGVSGGLWKNTNISSSTSVWTRVNIPENLSVSCITYDPSNTNVFYVGTGESYVGGDVNGDGVWKSTDGGASFTKVFGGISGPTTFYSSTNVVVNSPAGIAGNYSCYATTNFGAAITTSITSNIVLVDDGSGNREGCNPPLTNAAALNGKIALIRRGNCTFVIKVKAAQDAGAIAVIMMNNVDGTPIPMGGTDATITIPSLMISNIDGNTLEAALASGVVNATLSATGGTFTGNLVPGKQHINDIKIRNNAGNPEIYVAVGDSFYTSTNGIPTYLGGPDFGLYKSVNGGSTWSEISLPLTANGKKHCPNNIEIGADNTIWVSTNGSAVYGVGGGKIFASTDGSTFIDKYTVANGDRTEIAVSKTVAGKIYVLAEVKQVDTANPTFETTILKTLNGFATAPTVISLPVDSDTSARMTTYGFTGQQAYYDLLLGIDPNNDETFYVGGIDLFKTVNGGSSWSQISLWTSNVHSDQHGIAFANGASNKILFGNDGGVFFTNNSGTSISDRNSGFNVTQFYSVGVAPTSAAGGPTGDYFVAGAQDNGSQYFANAPATAGAAVEVQGGDGAHCMFDQGSDKYYITNYVYNDNINFRTTTGVVRNINSESADLGAFISPMALDSSKDILYTDYSDFTTPTYQIRRYTNLKSGTVGKTLLTNALLTSNPTAIAVSKYTTASTTLLVGCRNGKLLRVATANTTPVWSDLTSPEFVGSISDVEYGSSNNEIYVTFHNYGVKSIWYTADSGISWENKEGDFPDIPVKAILRNPLNVEEVIIGTELGVWFTNNFTSATPNWRQSYNGMSNVKVVDLDLRNDNKVFAATYGRGIFSGQFTSDTLSNNEVVNSKGVKVYPNPFDENVTLSIEKYTGKVAILVTDINGKIVVDLKNQDFNIEKSIGLNNLQTGVYLLKVSGENLNYTQKIVKK